MPTNLQWEERSICDHYCWRTEERFVVHESLLTFYSEFFRAALTGKSKEANEKTVEIENNAQTFEFFVFWLYHQQRFPDEDCGDDPDFVAKWQGEEEPEYHIVVDHLVKLYVLGDRYNIPRLRKAVIGEIFDHSYLGDGDSAGRCTVRYAFEWLRPKSPLCRLLVDLACDMAIKVEYDPEDEDNKQASDAWPHEYLLHTTYRFMEILGKVRYFGKDWEDFDLKLCDYHEHESDEEKAACKAEQDQKRKQEK